MTRTVFRACTLCEAMCGLAFEVEDNRILSVRPDDDDVFSRGYICPKGVAIAAIHDDPERLRLPLRRTAAGDFEPISWPAAFALAAERLRAIRAQHGKDAIAIYYGNPLVHNDWTDDQLVESVVGQSVLNGVPVRLRSVASDNHQEH